MKYGSYLSATLKPGGDLSCTLVVLLEPDRKRAESSLGKVARIRACTGARVPERSEELFVVSLLARKNPHHEVRVTADVFRCGMNGDVDPKVEGASVNRSRPC